MKNEYVENSIIGILIGYYRRKKSKLEKNDLFKSNRFIAYKSEKIRSHCLDCKNVHCRQNKMICSYSTFSAVEKGEAVKKICCYIDFADKLGMTYKLNKSMITEQDNLEEKIIQALEINDVNEFLELYKDVQYKLNEYKQVIYFSDIYNLYMWILKSQISQEFPEKDFIDLLELILPSLKDKTKYLSYYLLYRYYFTHDNEVEKDKFYLSQLRIMNPNNIEFFARSKIEEESLLETYSLLKNSLTDHLNDYEKYTIYQSLGYICLCFDRPEDGLQYVLLSKHIIEESSISFPRKEINQTYMRLGLFYYQLEDYDHALKNFSLVYKLNPNTLLLNILLFYNTFEKVNKTDMVYNVLCK